MKFEDYKKIRDEAEEYAKDMLKNIPADFTLLHLECLKQLVPKIVEDEISDLKSKVIVNQIAPPRERLALASRCDDNDNQIQNNPSRMKEENSPFGTPLM